MNESGAETQEQEFLYWNIYQNMTDLYGLKLDFLDFNEFCEWLDKVIKNEFK